MTCKMSLREWQVSEQLKRLWSDYKDTGSQMVYRQILRKEREKKILDKAKKGV